MKLELHNSVSKIIECTDDELVWAKDLISISEPQFRKNYRSGRMEYVRTVTKSLVEKDGKFPSGFARVLWRKAKTENPPIVMELVDKRKVPNAEPVDTDLSYLRDYQLEAVEAVLKYKHGILHHPTAAGKTWEAVGLVTKVPILWMFLVQDKDLLHQTAAVYKKRTGLDAGKIGDGLCEVPENCKFVVATAQTLNSRKSDDTIWNLIRNVEGIIIDEVHGLPATTMYKVAMAAENAYYRIGMSGTPLSRSDSKSIYTIGALGPVIHRVKADELIEKGYLSKPTIEMHCCSQVSNKKTLPGVTSELIVKSTKRNKLVADLAKKSTKPVLVFVNQVKHGKELTTRLEKAGITTEFMWGQKNTAQREQAVKNLIRGDTDCIVCSIFQQGVDFPELRSVVIAAGGKSERLTLQRIGRGMRTTKDKSTFEVYDIFDLGNKWLEDHSGKRKKSYEKEGHKVKIIQ